MPVTRAVIGRARAEALLSGHLGEERRAAHSRVVAELMAVLARTAGADERLWFATGLLHDIDDAATRASRNRHGVLAAEWLSGELPEEALAAIRAHDHRTGCVAEGPLADARKLADAAALLLETVGDSAMAALGRADARAALATAVPERPFLADIVVARAHRLGLSPSDLAGLLAADGRQTQRPPSTSRLTPVTSEASSDAR